jgi:hypothetical protein
MKIEDKHIETIKAGFAKMKSKQDLLDLLNTAKALLDGPKPAPLKLRQLTFHANPKLAGKRYHEFTIKKKSGEDRTILAPVPELKAIQKSIAFVMQCVFEPHKAAMGFVRNKSIVDNARIHQGSNYVYNIDLKDFFSSVDQARVWKCLQLRPFYLLDGMAEPDITFDRSKFHKYNHLPAKLQEKINKYSYEDYPFSEGSWSFETNNKATIVYKLEKRKPTEGTIVIFKSKSNLAPVRQMAESLIKGHNLDMDSEWLEDYLLEKVIVSHQNSLQKNETRLKLASCIASICCTEIEVERKDGTGAWKNQRRNVIPQGAPTSPVISNIICQRLDFLLTGVAKRFGLKYTRYADDITFSSMHNVYQPESEFLQEVDRIIAEQGFHLKESKTRLQKRRYRQEVTGLLVNDKVNVQQRYVKQLRLWLYHWERYGYTRANRFFAEQYIKDKGHLKEGRPDMSNVIGGKLDYLKMVKGNDSKSYFKLIERFHKLIKVNTSLDKMLDVWEKDGIKAAMALYQSQLLNHE